MLMSGLHVFTNADKADFRLGDAGRFGNWFRRIRCWLLEAAAFLGLVMVCEASMLAGGNEEVLLLGPRRIRTRSSSIIEHLCPSL